MRRNEWFDEWFNSPYYHILYKNRDEYEARLFIDAIVKKLQIDASQSILDVACGRGRHAIYLNSLGFSVTGIDLSKHNIAVGSNFSNERLQFFKHDMRQVFRKDGFDVILNLFTSFGYFDSHEDHAKAIQAITSSLKKGGLFLLDFLNPFTVIHQLAAKEKKVVDDISFFIEKSYDGKYIWKHIRFEHRDASYHFSERVKAIRRSDFLAYFEKANLEILETFGDYQLNPYAQSTSERLIFLLKK